MQSSVIEADVTMVHYVALRSPFDLYKSNKGLTHREDFNSDCAVCGLSAFNLCP